MLIHNTFDYDTCKGRCVWSAEAVALLRDLVEENKSNDEIAQQLDNAVSPHQVREKRRSLGIHDARTDTWTPARVDLLKQLWAEGYSANQVARRIGGVTRNAVIGKVHRLGLETRACVHRSKTVRGSGRKQRRRERRTFPASVFIPVAPLPPEPNLPAKLFRLIDLEDNQCRFPYGDPKRGDFGFCGCKKMAGSSFCPGHHGKVYTGVPVRERSKDLPVWRGKHRLDKHGSKYAGKAVAV